MFVKYVWERQNQRKRWPISFLPIHSLTNNSRNHSYVKVDFKRLKL